MEFRTLPYANGRREPAVPNERAITTILFDAGGVLVHLDYSFLARGLRAAGIPVISRDLRRAE